MRVRFAFAGSVFVALVAISLLSSKAAAQATPSLLPPGAAAPDVQVAGATRYGVLAEPVRLSQFRGKTVVLAFFFRARTPG